MSAQDEDPRSSTRIIAVATGLALLAGFAGSAAAFMATARYLSDHNERPAIIGAAFAYGAVILALAWAFGRVCQRAMRRRTSPAARRYQRRFMTAMSVYVFLIISAVGAFRYFKPDGVLAYGLAIAPALPLIAAIGVIGLYLREETDEFERAVQTEAALWATGGMLAIATSWGFLEMFGLVQHVESWWAFPIWAALLAPGQLLARRRYQ
jgi:hypothetical protein